MDQLDPQYTPHSNAESEEESSALRLEMIYETAPVGLCALDPELHFIHMNQRMAEISGVSRSELLGRSIQEATPAWAELAEPLLERVIQSGDPIRDVKMTSESAGRPAPLRLWKEHYYPLRNENEVIVGINIVVEDVTLDTPENVNVQDYFQQLANAMPQLVWTTEPDGRVDYYNQRWSEFRNLRPEQHKGWNWTSLIHPNEREQTIEAWQRALQTGEPYQIEHRAMRSDGSYRWYLSRALPVRDKQGQIVKWCGTTTDIHYQKETERALRESEEKYRTMFELSAVGQAELDLLSGHYLSVNDKFCEITGYSEEELLQMDYIDITHPDDVEADHARFEELLAGEQEEYVSVKKYIRKDGATRWVEARARLIRNASGKPVRSLGFVVDITDRVEAEAERERLLSALSRERQQLEELTQTLEKRVEERTRELQGTNEELKLTRDLFYTLFHANPLPTVITRSSDGVILDVNEAQVNYFGWERQEMIGRTTMDLKFWRDAKEREHFLTELRESGRVRNMEVRVELPSGEMRTCLVSVEPIELNGESCIISSLVDITERVQAERKLRRLASELVIAEQRERQRVAHVLHDDIQQMLYSLQLNLHLLATSAESELKGELEKLVNHVAETVEATRNLSTELQSPAARNEHLRNIFRWLSHFMESQYGLAVEVQVDADLRIREETRRELIARAVRELLFNVVKHAKTTKARVHASEREGQLVIQVIDKGVGFDPDNVSSTHDTYMGLGLNSIRERLSLFGGQFSVESRPGTGTRATMVLPIEHGD